MTAARCLKVLVAFALLGTKSSTFSLSGTRHGEQEQEGKNTLVSDSGRPQREARPVREAFLVI